MRKSFDRLTGVLTFFGFDQRFSREFLLYVVTGLTVNTLSYLCFLLITYLGLDPKLAVLILYVASMTASFFANRTWVFVHDGKIHWAAIRFLGSYLSGLLLNLGILWLFTDVLGFPYQIVQLCAVIGIAIFLFLMSRYFVFSDR